MSLAFVPNDDIQKNNIAGPVIVRAIIAFLATIYFFSSVASPADWRFFDSVDVVFHEAGHTIAFFLPELLSTLSGSILQVLIPLLIAIYFFVRRNDYAGSMVLFWAGQSIINVSVYIGDAVEMSLPLLGGDGAIHDWNYILSVLGLLSNTETIATLVYSVGLVTLMTASVLSILFSWPQKKRGSITYAGALIEHNGKILIVGDEGSPNKTWSLPIGPVLQKEEEADAARRIVFSKTGLSVGLSGVPSVILAKGSDLKVVPEDDLCTVRLYMFFATITGGGPKEIAGEEQGSFQFLAPEEVGRSTFKSLWVGSYMENVARVMKKQKLSAKETVTENRQNQTSEPITNS